MVCSVTAFRQAVAMSATVATIALSPVFTAIAEAQVRLTGAGATFPAPLYERYISDFRKSNSGVAVSYQGVGSGAGIRQFIANTIQFGGSDAAMTDEEIGKVKRGVILVPTAGGAVSVIYNLPGVRTLKLSREALGAIFAGEITKWNDPRIAKANPGVKLPDTGIKLAVRADGSGTSFIFTNHLAATSPAFKGKVGAASTAPKWAGAPLKGKGNSGVADLVSRTPGSIGYVELIYAREKKLPSAILQNKKGQFVAPSLQATNQALAGVRFPSNFRVFESDPAAGYPIVGFTWMMVYKQYPSADEAKAAKTWIRWVLTEGQKLNDDLGYAAVPPAVARQVLSVVQKQVKP